LFKVGVALTSLYLFFIFYHSFRRKCDYPSQTCDDGSRRVCAMDRDWITSDMVRCTEGKTLTWKCNDDGYVEYRPPLVSDGITGDALTTWNSVAQYVKVNLIGQGIEVEDTVKDMKSSDVFQLVESRPTARMLKANTVCISEQDPRGSQTIPCTSIGYRDANPASRKIPTPGLSQS